MTYKGCAVRRSWGRERMCSVRGFFQKVNWFTPTFFPLPHLLAPLRIQWQVSGQTPLWTSFPTSWPISSDICAWSFPENTSFCWNILFVAKMLWAAIRCFAWVRGRFGRGVVQVTNWMSQLSCQCCSMAACCQKLYKSAAVCRKNLHGTVIRAARMFHRRLPQWAPGTEEYHYCM